MPAGTGANGALARASAVQAACGSGCVPPALAGAQVSVTRRGVAPWCAATLMVSADGFGAPGSPDAAPVALPQAAARVSVAARAPAPAARCGIPVSELKIFMRI